MPQRHCSKIKHDSAKRSKRITLPISEDAYYVIIDDEKTFRDYLDMMIDLHPELFPQDILVGYHLHGLSPISKKMPETRTRRIKLKAKDESGRKQVYTVAPSFVMPYRTGYTDAIEKALFLHGRGISFEDLTYVFGRNDQYWYRLVVSLGRNDLVGTTIKFADNLPEHVLADEKHTWINGKKAYIAMTVAKACILGASIALQADTPALTEAYGHFKEESQRLQSDYQPKTVNTDGWGPTQKGNYSAKAD
jgi:hypothetical protein